MEVKQINLIYFSATGTTQKVLESVAKGIAVEDVKHINGSVTTKIELCIRCCACIKNCPTGARVVEDSIWKGIAGWLYENCSTRKEPQIFGV